MDVMDEKAVMEALKGLRYSIIVDGASGSMECAYIRDARFYAMTETLNAKERVEIYDREVDDVIETYYPEDL